MAGEGIFWKCVWILIRALKFDRVDASVIPSEPCWFPRSLPYPK